MEIRDIIVTPLLLILVYGIAYLVRPYATDQVNRKYFIPGLSVRIVGALAVGFIYQFYYQGGDTFAFHTYGSRLIWNAFVDDPYKGVQLLFSDGEYIPDLYKYSSKIWYYRDPQSYFVIRIAAIFDLFTFSSYSATAVLFAVVGFTGAWLLFLTFYKIEPNFHRWLALSCLFIPTVFFWGSGIFKDTLTLAALGIATFFIHKLLVEKKYSIMAVIIILLSFWIIYSIKKYILLSFLPAIIVWIMARQMYKIRSLMLKLILVPVMILISGSFGYFTIQQVAADDPRYNLNKLAETARTTAYDIRYWTGKDAGSGYTLGELDGSFGSMISLAPGAINVALFRPYLWEVSNPLMLLAAFEGIVLFVLTIFVFIHSGRRIFRYLQNGDVIFCLLFSLVFAFAVGVSTYNFGTLSRYKIPLIPFYLIGIGLIYYYSKRDKKLNVLEETEK
ncbi:MAG TPA: hypothetical protein VD884_21905 [Ohtaekwangia sp.]|nr:hypothetical protein [Ohtaekwangia sp.]